MSSFDKNPFKIFQWNLEWSSLKLQVSSQAAESISRKAAEAAAAEAAAIAAHSNLTGMAMTLVVCFQDVLSVHSLRV